MRGKRKGLALLVCVLALLMFPPVWAAKAPEKNDIRVLIDISGSMRQNDPQNLRRPALRMLVGLMQPGTRAGVWTFAKWTNPLVPMAEVDQAWKDKAMSAAKQITSPGLFTHIERVIEDAIRDWEGDPTTHNRHLVLLTDGMVDVSKDAAESAASRQRIIEKLLPQLKSLGVRTHTIALSERADHDLMKELSSNTDGWYQQVESADKLQRVFLKIFEQVSKPDSVPLNDNKFTVDSSVREATVLLFRKPGAPDPVLVSPAGERFTDSDILAGVAWYRDEGYDLITIASPSKGEWGLEADLDPDNRVMIVTALKLETSEIPAHIVVGEKILASANLTNQGKLVRRKAFLKLLDVRADAMTEAGTDPLGLNDAGQDGDEQASDGRYTLLYQEGRPFEEVELLFSVESPTFMREKRYRLSVHEPVTLRVEGEGDAAKVYFDLHSVMRDDADITVWQEDPSGAKLDLQADGEGAHALKDPNGAIYATVVGLSRLGNSVKRDVGPLYPSGKPPAVAPETTPAPVSDPVEAAEPEPVAEPEKDDLPPEKEKAEEDDSGLLPIILFGSVNLLLIGGGLAAWLIIRKRRAGQEDSLLEEYADDRDPAQKSAAAAADGDDPDETIVHEPLEPGQETAA